jgi:hypothetical protein
MSGLKINFQESENFCILSDDSILDFYLELFGCDISHFPMKYLGVPVDFVGL